MADQVEPIPSETVEQRLRRLEDIAFEGDGLRRSVDRLGLNANALSEALQTVDRNQQRLTQLGGELEHVQRITATKEEVEKTRKQVLDEQLAYRRLILGRAYAAAVLVLALFAVFAVVSVNYVDSARRQRLQVCEDSAARAQASRGYFVAVAQNSENPKLRQRAVEAIQAIDAVKCEGL